MLFEVILQSLHRESGAASHHAAAGVVQWHTTPARLAPSGQEQYVDRIRRLCVEDRA